MWVAQSHGGARRPSRRMAAAAGLHKRTARVRDLRSQASISYPDLMLATRGKLFSANGWIFELKHDGFRCLITKRGNSVRMESRSGGDMSPCFPELRYSAPGRPTLCPEG
jgi:ATP-dependent DNA ligase